MVEPARPYTRAQSIRAATVPEADASVALGRADARNNSRWKARICAAGYLPAAVASAAIPYQARVLVAPLGSRTYDSSKAQRSEQERGYLARKRLVVN